MKFSLKYDQSKCSGCLQCQLTCSFIFFKAYRLHASHIQIDTRKTEYSAFFSENCTHCGQCADICLFGALTKSKQEVVA